MTAQFTAGAPPRRLDDHARRVPPTDAATVDLLDARLRQLVRRDQVDPQEQVPAVRTLAESVVHAHDQLSLTGQVASIADPPALVEELVARVAGFGPLQVHLDDPSVEEFRPEPLCPQPGPIAPGSTRPSFVHAGRCRPQILHRRTSPWS